MDNDFIEVELDHEMWVWDGHLMKPLVMMHGVGAVGVMVEAIRVLKPGTKLRLQVTRAS